MKIFDRDLQTEVNLEKTSQLTPKSMEELGDELCDYCHTEESNRQITQFTSGCEGSYCHEAYDMYLDSLEEIK